MSLSKYTGPRRKQKFALRLITEVFDEIIAEENNPPKELPELTAFELTVLRRIVKYGGDPYTTTNKKDQQIISAAVNRLRRKEFLHYYPVPLVLTAEGKKCLAEKYKHETTL